MCGLPLCMHGFHSMLIMYEQELSNHIHEEKQNTQKNYQNIEHTKYKARKQTQVK